MSTGYNPKNEQTMNQALKVQELAISGSDANVFAINSGNCIVYIREPVEKVYLVSVKVDSTNLVTQFAQASLSIVDSSSLLAGGNQQAIKITGLAALQPNDCLVVRYSVLEHL